MHRMMMANTTLGVTCVFTGIGMLMEDGINSLIPNTTLIGALMVIGIITIIVISSFTILRKQIFALIIDFLKSKEGTIVLEESIGSYLRKDESELNKMRSFFTEDINTKFSNLESLILTAQSSQHDELEKFRTESFNSLVELNHKVISVLEKQLDK